MLHVHLTKQRWCGLMRKVATFTVQSLVGLQVTFIFSTPVSKLTMKCWNPTWMIVRLLVLTNYVDYMFYLLPILVLFGHEVSLFISNLITNFGTTFVMFCFTPWLGNWNGCTFFWIWKYCGSRRRTEWAGDVGS